MESARHRQFLIRDCLGRGGFGEVYRAEMVSPGGLRTQVALKLLRLDVDPNGDAMSRLRDEGRLLAALRHPSILRAYDLALLEGRIGLVTEYVEGQDLHRVIGDQPDPLPPRASMQMAGSVAEALAAAWDTRLDGRDQPLQLVHRDIKPSNIRLGLHGEVKLLDFGIARSDEVDREARTGTGSTVGSLSYMAPERFSRVAPGPEADIYALGCTLFEALAGVRLHQDPVPVEMFRLAANPDTHDKHVDDALDTLSAEVEAARPLLYEMLRHDRSLRPDAKTVAHRADEIQENLPGNTVKRWARARDWPEPEHVAGNYDGRTITEGTLSGQHYTPLSVPTTDGAETFSFDVSSEKSTAAVGVTNPTLARLEPEPVEEEPRRAGAVWFAVPIGVLLLLTFAFGAWWSQPGAPDPVPEPDPVPVATPDPEPVVEPTPDPDPEPVATPVTPDPEPAAKPDPEPTVTPDPEPTVTPDPEPVEAPDPEPVAEPEPAPEPVEPAMGSVTIRSAGSMTIRFRNGAGDMFSAGPMPAGQYSLFINGRDSGTIIPVYDGIATGLKCNPVGLSCSRL